MTEPDREPSRADVYLAPNETAPHEVPPKTYDPHPLFPRDDDTPEDADIRFVTFIRRTPATGIEHCRVDFPASKMQSWQQVVDMYGGGDYQAVAKDKNHRILRYCPKAKEWMSFDGEPKPLLKRGTPTPPAPCPPAPATQPVSAEIAELLARLDARLGALEKEAREGSAALPPQGQSEGLLALWNQQQAQLDADAKMRIAHIEANAKERLALLIEQQALFEANAKERLALLIEQQARFEADAKVRVAEIEASSKERIAHIEANAALWMGQLEVQSQLRAALAQETAANNELLLAAVRQRRTSEERLIKLLVLLKQHGIIREAQERFPPAATEPAKGTEIKSSAETLATSTTVLEVGMVPVVALAATLTHAPPTALASPTTPPAAVDAGAPTPPPLAPAPTSVVPAGGSPSVSLALPGGPAPTWPTALVPAAAPVRGAPAPVEHTAAPPATPAPTVVALAAATAAHATALGVSAGALAPPGVSTPASSATPTPGAAEAGAPARGLGWESGRLRGDATGARGEESWGGPPKVFRPEGTDADSRGSGRAFVTRLHKKTSDALVVGFLPVSIAWLRSEAANDGHLEVAHG